MPRLKDKHLAQEAEAEQVREKAEKKDVKRVKIIKKTSRKN
jgi:hypothetical protein